MPKMCRRITTLIAALLVSAAALAAGPAAPANAATYLTTAKIWNAWDNGCLQSYYLNSAIYSSTSCGTSSYQVWKIYQVGTDPYGARIVQLRNGRTGGCITASGKYEGTYVSSTACSSLSNWIWHGGSAGAGSYGTTFQLNGTTLYLGLTSDHSTAAWGYYNSAYHQTFNAYPA
jgi:hypothetical protein